jgi:hypothetical protein
VALEIRSELAQLQQLGAIEGAGLGPRRVQNRRRVPFESTKRSAPGCCGSFGSNRISAKNSAAVMSAIEQQLVGMAAARSSSNGESIRSCVAMFFKAGINVARSVA